MNVFTFTGHAIGNPQTGRTQADKTKTMFIVEADPNAGDLPLRFSCVAFGGIAEQAAEITDRDRLLLTGKMIGNAYNKSMNVIVSSLEFLGEQKCQK
jgi:hypothetical protein